MKDIGLTHVTERIKQVQQPYGGLLKPSVLTKTSYGAGMEALNENENVHGSLIGTTVENLATLLVTDNKVKAFGESLEIAADIFGDGERAIELLDEIVGLDYASIRNALQLSACWSYHFAGIPVSPIGRKFPDAATAENIATMVGRTVDFLSQYDTVVPGFTFQPAAFTDKVMDGLGDYLTDRAIIDLKVISGRPNKNYTLQILMYWRMGLRSGEQIYKDVQEIGLFAPRQNIFYHIPVNEIPRETIEKVDRDVIGYSEVL